MSTRAVLPWCKWPTIATFRTVSGFDANPIKNLKMHARAFFSFCLLHNLKLKIVKD